jgi:hypothetical protein
MTAMKAFDYHKPSSVPEAAALFASGSEIRPLAGGMFSFRPAGSSADFVVYVPERKFFSNPFGIGDTVLATWPINVARVLR